MLISHVEDYGGFQSISDAFLLEPARNFRPGLLSKIQDRYGQVGDKQETMTIKMKLEYADEFMTLIKWVLVSFTSFCSKTFSLSVPFFRKISTWKQVNIKTKTFSAKILFAGLNE